MFVIPTCAYCKHVCNVDIWHRVCEIIHVRAPDSAKPAPPSPTKQFYKDVGLRIRQARQDADNMSQEALANSVGLSRTSLTNIEKGRQNVLLHTFTQIASALGVAPAALLPCAETKLETVLDGMGVSLPSSLGPEERGFIERVIGTGGQYENQQTKRDRSQSKRTTPKK